MNFPVYTFSSGATNSMRGAAFLSQQKDAIIVDIGGTSTDIGVLKNGFPREASTRIRVRNMLPKGKVSVFILLFSCFQKISFIRK